MEYEERETRGRNKHWCNRHLNLTLLGIWLGASVTLALLQWVFLDPIPLVRIFLPYYFALAIPTGWVLHKKKQYVGGVVLFFIGAGFLVMLIALCARGNKIAWKVSRYLLLGWFILVLSVLVIGFTGAYFVSQGYTRTMALSTVSPYLLSFLLIGTLYLLLWHWKVHLWKGKRVKTWVGGIVFSLVGLLFCGILFVLNESAQGLTNPLSISVTGGLVSGSFILGIRWALVRFNRERFKKWMLRWMQERGYEEPNRSA